MKIPTWLISLGLLISGIFCVGIPNDVSATLTGGFGLWLSGALFSIAMEEREIARRNNNTWRAK